MWKHCLALVKMESGSMNTAFLLMAQYGGKAINDWGRLSGLFFTPKSDQAGAEDQRRWNSNSSSPNGNKPEMCKGRPSSGSSQISGRSSWGRQKRDDSFNDLGATPAPRLFQRDPDRVATNMTGALIKAHA
jgi:hypothetical protein